MSTQQLTQQAMALPPAERVSLAQALWDSVELGEDADLTGVPPAQDADFWNDLDKRSRELTDGIVPGTSWDEAMKSAKAALGCV
jgi:putative addiction module component (TIGR02574 family)